MSTQVFNTILCSGLLFIFYKIILEGERMYLFNRIYLLLSMALSITIPWITINEISRSNTFTDSLIVITNSINLTTSPAEISNSILDWVIIIRVIYLGISGIFLIRFIKNILALIIKIKSNIKLNQKYNTLVLIDDCRVSYSFFHFIFIDKADFYNSKIENEMLQHEAAHAKQLHSLDIIIIELFQILIWFNPILIFYKKAIQLNHEFLADETVLKCNDLERYQHLLVAKATTTQFPLSSQFNYLTTKKRILMMTKTTSLPKALCIQIAIVPILVCAFFLFSTKAIAQGTAVKNIKKLEPEATIEGVSNELLTEYESLSIIAKASKGRVSKKNGFTQADSYRLETIFLLMNNEQRERQPVTFIRIPAFEKSTPTPEQFESLKDAKTYGVWLNGKRINNEELNNYKNTDFSSFTASILMKNARVNVNYAFQAGLITNKYYDEHVKETLATTNLTMMIKR